jgi:hypothetical protein
MSLLGHRPEERKIEAIYFDELFDTEFPPQPWYVENLLPRCAKLLLGGPPKIGKTFLLTEFARALTCGVPLFDFPYFAVPAQVGVTMVDQEVGQRGMQKRARGAFADQPRERYKGRALLISREPSLRIDTMEGFKAIRTLLSEFKPNVLLLDPMTRLHGADENDNSQMAQIFSRLDMLLHEFRGQEMSIVLAHHFGKKPRGKDAHGYDPLDPDNFRGAGDWFGWPDAVITVERRWREGKCGPDKKGWFCHMRTTLRHCEEAPDLRVSINQLDDSRVRYMGTLEAPSVDEDEPYQEKGRGLRL